jgi:hypothetical protein
MEGERYCRLTVEWDYASKKVHLLMLFYIEKALTWFQHPPPIVLQDQLYQHMKKTSGAKVQHANLPDDSPPLDKAGKKLFRRL